MSTSFGQIDFNTALYPNGPYPLDSRLYFESLELASAAAESAVEAGPSGSGSIYYFGQIISVYENNIPITYVIKPNENNKGTLVRIGDEDSSITDLKGKVTLLENNVGKPTKYINTYTISSGQTSLNVNHNLNSLDINFNVYKKDTTSNTYKSILCEVEIIDVNNIKLSFSDLSAEYELKVIVF